MNSHNIYTSSTFLSLSSHIPLLILNSLITILFDIHFLLTLDSNLYGQRPLIQWRTANSWCFMSDSLNVEPESNPECVHSSLTLELSSCPLSGYVIVVPE